MSTWVQHDSHSAPTIVLDVLWACKPGLGPHVNPAVAFNDIGTSVRVHARRNPDAVAVKEIGGDIRTYGQLDERTNRLANAFLGTGMRPGDRVAAWMGDVVEYVEVYIAAAKAGMIVVPINNRLTAGEAAFQIENTDPKVLIHTPEIAERVEALPGVEELTIYEASDGSQESGRDSLENLLAPGKADPLPPPDREAPWMICFTSGTTGRPKGAVLTHRSVLTLAQSQHMSIRIPPYGVNIQAVSMSFPATVGSHMTSHLIAGGTQVLAAASWDSARLLDLVERERATHIYVPGPVLPEFTEEAATDPARWRTLTSVLHAGSKADPEVLEAFANVVGPIYTEGWGMTEISGGLSTATTAPDFHAGGERLFATVGRPVPGTRIIAVGSDRNPLPPEEVGELALFSPSLFAGYWRDEVATKNAVEDGWYYSGDMGSVDTEGYVYISDRRTNMIVSGGMNIYPAEIELAFERSPDVAECAVVGVPHEKWGETPVAVVVPAPGAGSNAVELMEHIGSQVASYKKPSRIVFVDELPRTSGQKVRRAEVRAMVEDLQE